MKKLAMILISITIVILSGCNAKSIGIIGGADGPTNIFLSRGKYDKESIRIVRLDGALYYETGDDVDDDERCGTPDGSFTKTVGKYEIPQNDGESNFRDAGKYQFGAEADTIEIPIDDDLEIFKKIDTTADVLGYKYCYVLEGKLNNAEDDSEFLVLSNDKNTTFDEAAYVILGSDSSKMKDIYVLPIED